MEQARRPVWLLCRLSTAPRCFAVQAPEPGNGQSSGQQEPSAASVQHVIFPACVCVLSKPAHRINSPYEFGNSLGDIRRQSASGANGEKAILVSVRRPCFALPSSDVVGDETDKSASHRARSILRPRENPKRSHLRNPGEIRIDAPSDFRVLTWTEYILGESSEEAPQ